MTEVALEAGVSQTTVSLVLNEVSNARFSADTRKRVLDAAERLNYRTTRRRNVFRGTPQGTIAFVVDEMSTDPWMALAMDGIRGEARFAQAHGQFFGREFRAHENNHRAFAGF